jgi:hypothetical protein
MTTFPTFDEFKKISFRSRLKLERKMAMDDYLDGRTPKVVGYVWGWKCDCGFECHENKDFYEHLVAHEQGFGEPLKQLCLFDEPQPIDILTRP